MTNYELDGFHTLLNHLWLDKSEFYSFAMMAQCNIPECGQCAVIMCPNGDPMHLHHDGCPACDVNDHSGPVTIVEADMKEQIKAADFIHRQLLNAVR